MLQSQLVPLLGVSTGVVWTVAVVGGMFALLIIGMILSRLYQRASKEISFVRTGFGGQKVHQR